MAARTRATTPIILAASSNRPDPDVMSSGRREKTAAPVPPNTINLPKTRLVVEKANKWRKLMRTPVFASHRQLQSQKLVEAR